MYAVFLEDIPNWQPEESTDATAMDVAAGTGLVLRYCCIRTLLREGRVELR